MKLTRLCSHAPVAALLPARVGQENQLWKGLRLAKGSSMRAAQDWLQKKTSFSIPLFFGRGLLQYTFGFMPYRTPITVCVGKPLACPAFLGEGADGRDPPRKLVQEMHAKYLEALKKLYDDNKVELTPEGYEPPELVYH